MRITFVATRKNQDRTERELYEMDLMLRALGFARSFLDLGLQTVAACTPRGVDIKFVDEYLEEIDYSIETDAVALSAKTSCATRAYEVAREFRARGTKVILGGIHASLRPEEALEHVDCIVTGEAEALWPRVVRDLDAGTLKRRYDAGDYPPMDSVPVPMWSGIDTSRYLFHQIQTTRGCPFRCKFCSVPDISGQEFRFKPVAQVVHELRSLPRARGLIARSKPLYVVDDNFISRSKYTKELLRALVPLAQNREIPPWSAETTLNVASDEEMLDLLRDAGCSNVIIGFESVVEATLNEMDKPVNFCLTYQDAIDRIHSRGMTIVGNFIVGFDTDTRTVFKDTIDFVQKTGILYPFFSILTPMPGTGLFDESKASGRLDHERWELYDTRHVVFEPRQMRRDELMDGYVWLYEQAYGDKLLERIERNWERAPSLGRASSWAERAFIAARLAPEMLRTDGAGRRLYARGIQLMMNRKLHADAAQLLFTLDGYDFASFMRRFNTSRRDENYRTFASAGAAVASAAATEKSVMQWENKKAIRFTQKRAGA